MQAMSDRVAALRRLVAELERGGENHALTPEDFVRVGLESPADEGAAGADVSGDEAAGSTDGAMRVSSPSAGRTAWIGRDAAGHGFARRGRPLPTRDDDDRQDCATWARSAVSEHRDGSGRGTWPVLESDDASLRTAAGVDGHGADAAANEEGYPAEAAGGRFRLSPARFSIAARGEDDGAAVAEPASAMRRAGLPAAASKFGQRAARLSDAQTAAGARVAALAVSPSGEADRRAAPRLALGVAAVDAVLGGGLDRAGLHEIHAAGIGDEAAAAGFVVALCALALTDPAVAPPPATAGVVALPAAAPGRAAPAMTDAPRNPAPAGEGDASTLSGGARAGAVVWIETQFSEAEDGLLWPAGLEDVGLDPRRLVRVKVGRVLEALAAAEEALASPALAAIVLEIRGAAPALDLVALRRLTLAARRHGRPCLLLRTGARPVPTPALTRWAIAARPAVAPLATGWGRRQMGSPAIHAALTRQRAGRDGAWTLEWCADVACFRQPVPQPSVSVPGDRPAEPIRRHAG